jgi:CO dehydrogenase nickel-insertion accessory protein CooC1
MRLSGWHRLWVFISAIYLIVVVAYSFYAFPKSEKVVHKYEFYTKLSSKSLDMIVERGKSKEISISNQDVTEVKMPNGHIIPFNSEVAQKDMENAAREYWSIVEQETRNQRAVFAFYAFLFWLLSCSLVYALGWGVGWVYKGFRS